MSEAKGNTYTKAHLKADKSVLQRLVEMQEKDLVTPRSEISTCFELPEPHWLRLLPP
jgi:hypothetical protein